MDNMKELIAAANDYGSELIKGHKSWTHKDSIKIKAFIDGAKWLNDKSILITNLPKLIEYLKSNINDFSDLSSAEIAAKFKKDFNLINK